MNQSAIVKKEVRSGVVEVSLLRQVECGLSCGGDCAGCMQKPQGEILALASNPIGAKPGERVEVEATSGSSIGIALLIFAIPCGLGEMPSVGMAGLGLVVGFLPAVLVNRAVTRRQEPEFTILRQF